MAMVSTVTIHNSDSVEHIIKLTIERTLDQLYEVMSTNYIFSLESVFSKAIPNNKVAKVPKIQLRVQTIGKIYKISIIFFQSNNTKQNKINRNLFSPNNIFFLNL